MMDGLLYPVDPEGCAPSFGASSTKPDVVGEGTDSTGGRETPKAKVSRRGGILRELCWTRLLCWAPRQRLPFSRGTLTSSVLLCARQAKWQLFQSGDNLTLSAPNRILVPTLTLVWECPLLITWVPMSHPLETEVPQSVGRGEAGPWAEWMNEWKAGRAGLESVSESLAHAPCYSGLCVDFWAAVPPWLVAGHQDTLVYLCSHSLCVLQGLTLGFSRQGRNRKKKVSFLIVYILREKVGNKLVFFSVL